MERRVLISGCSGGGKSSLLADLARRGCRTVAEPGRRVIAEERRTGGTAFPWRDMTAFARRALAMAIADHERAADAADRVFFDRGIVDAAVALAHATGSAIDPAARSRRYHHTVFLAPPWPEVFVDDAERRHGLDEAVAEYRRLAAVLPELGYEPIELPRTSVEDRALFVLRLLA